MVNGINAWKSLSYQATKIEEAAKEQHILNMCSHGVLLLATLTDEDKKICEILD